MTGSSTSLRVVTTIATNVPASSGSYIWSIPTSIESGTAYAIQFSSDGLTAYSAYFTIVGSSSGRTLSENDD
ncbi:hypothetical protein BJV82DRAFT_166179 [Fennellomyces sp. T-0311]|nr:hypothetical protein BJV82DRAFT_166179 [Fennellomyces sp. T-0311]